MLDLRQDFPLLRQEINGRPVVYLDSAATSLKPQAVIDAVLGFYTRFTANVHRAVHALAEEATERFEGARRKVALSIGADEGEIVFTRGTTEAINMVRRCYPGLNRFVTTAIEHHSNFLPWAYGPDSTVLPVDGEGQPDLDVLDRALDRGVDLVAVGHVSNALGVLLPIEEIIGRAHRAGALVLVDAAQSVPHLPIDVKQLDADFLTFSAHKMLGPGGIGALYAKADLLERMGPWLLGGDMIEEVHLESYSAREIPHRLEAGTPAIEAAIGWAAAVDYLAGVGMARVSAHDRELVGYALERLQTVPKVRVVSPRDPARLSAAVSFQVENLEAHGVARMLSDRASVMVRSGFLCAQPLHESMELLPTVRASFYLYNSKSDIDTLARCLHEVVRFV